MITKNLITERAKELEIPATNYFSLAVSLLSLEKIYEKLPKRVLLMNQSELSVMSSKERILPAVVLGVTEEISSEIVASIIEETLTKQGLTVSTEILENGVKAGVTAEDIYTSIFFKLNIRELKDITSEELILHDITANDRTFTISTYPAEQLLLIDLTEILEKLELINDMSHYRRAYEILSSMAINGRRIREGLIGAFSDKKLSADRVNMIESFADYKYMKNKWKAYKRQNKKSDMELNDIIDCLIRFLRPIITSIESGQMFLGDWMPQLKRFLD